MFLLILGIGVLILVLSNKNTSTVNRCEKVHHWVIRFDNGDKKGYLVCKTCGHIPGEE